jgi:hypothetical protein
MSMDGKILPSAKVAPMKNEMSPAPLNPDSARNPSLANGNAPPAVPASHAQTGISNPGMNGPSVPRYPLGQRDR